MSNYSGEIMQAYSVLEIPESGVNLDKELHTDWLNTNLNLGIRQKELTVAALNDGRAKLELRKIDPDAPGGPVIQINGMVNANIKAHCVRCLAQVELEVQSHVNQTLFPAPTTLVQGNEPKKEAKSVKEDTTLIAAPEDLDDDTYLGINIDLPSIVRESILLELDMNTVCEDQNSCETRTQALLASACSKAEKPKIDPRWVALKKFQLKTE